MNPVFTVKKCEDNGIIIIGESLCVQGYLPESSKLASYDRYKYSECYTFNVVMYESDGEESFFANAISCHNTSIDESRVTLSKDGIYNIHHIIIPTVEWLQDKLTNEDDFLDYYRFIYVTDGEYIYLYKDNQYSLCKPEDLVQINPYKTTLMEATMSVFSIYELYKCYINKCITLLNDPNACSCNRGSNSDLIFSRDFVWMAINVIEYYIKRDLLYAAEDILKDVQSCNGFCSNLSDEPSKLGCGCGGNRK